MEAIERGLSQPIHDIRVLAGQRVPMRDGVGLTADVYLPAGVASAPAILIRTPYEAASDRYITAGDFFARRGYGVVVQDCRGCFRSDGVFQPWFDDATDGYDTLDWLAQQAWCTGRVGMWGPSYMGHDQWLVAPLRHPCLAALVPQVCASDFWRQCHYVDGAGFWGLNLLMTLLWGSSRAMSVRPGLYDHARLFRTLPLVDADREALGHSVPFFQDWLRHPTYSEYWQRISNEDKYSEIDLPIFNQGGWYDAYAGAAFRNFTGMIKDGRTEAARRSQKVLIGPWSHSLNHSPGQMEHDKISQTTLGDYDFGPAGIVALAQQQLRWYDHWLKGVDTGFLDEPSVQIFTMGINQWRQEREWPVNGTEFTAWYLDSAGRANSLEGNGKLVTEPAERSHPDSFAYNPERPVPTWGGNHSLTTWAHIMTVGPLDQRPIERRDDVLVYTSAPLERDLEVTGPVRATLYVASSARDTDFTARLIDVYQGGYAMNLCEGVARARYHRSRDEPILLEPGEVYELSIDLQVTSNVFKRGHCVRLDISSSNFPRYDRNLNTGADNSTTTLMEVARQTIYHDIQYPSRVVLPVISSV